MTPVASGPAAELHPAHPKAAGSAPREPEGGALTWTRTLPQRFPFGLAPFIILTLTLISGVWLALHPVKRREGSLVMWTFAHMHRRAYLPAIRPAPAEGTPDAKPVAPGSTFEEQHPGESVDLQLVHGTAINSRLRAAFQADLDVPDLVEVEISQAGSFMRGPEEEIGFRDLTPYLKEAGLLDPARFITTSYAAYTHRGKIYGMPRGVHPVMLAYRRDLFEQLGLDPAQLTTWEQFAEAGRRVFVAGERHLIMLPENEPWGLHTFLYQRDLDLFNADGALVMDDERIAQMIEWYARLAAGPKRISGDPGFWTSAFYQALDQGYVLSFICPDWRAAMTEINSTGLKRTAGNMALMPLPAFEPGGRRTSTWGGTMVGLTRKCARPELAWQLAMRLYTDADGMAAIFRETCIIPPARDLWNHPCFDEPRPFWSNQKVGRLFLELAPSVPRTYPSPHFGLAVTKMNDAMAASIAFLREHGEAGLSAFLRARLKANADYVRKQMERNPW